MSKQAFDQRIEEIEALLSAPEESAREQLGRALKDRSNFLVAKAATVAGKRQMQSLTPELLAAFDRLMEDPVKSDPQCWGKNAISKTLKDLGHTAPAVFLRGVAHVQMEPVWGRRVDTAATLRGTCALALVACDMDGFEILTSLTDLLNDPETPVRIDAAQAIAQLSAKEGTLPLRLKALIGDAEPEVVGHCFSALLSLAPRESLGFVAKFLRSPDPDLHMEAAGALAGAREPEALDYLKQFWSGQTEPEVKRMVLSLLAGSPLASAAEFLFLVLQDASGQTAVDALTALLKSRYRAQFQERAVALVADRKDPVLAEVLDALTNLRVVTFPRADLAEDEHSLNSEITHE